MATDRLNELRAAWPDLDQHLNTVKVERAGASFAHTMVFERVARHAGLRVQVSTHAEGVSRVRLEGSPAQLAAADAAFVSHADGLDLVMVFLGAEWGDAAKLPPAEDFADEADDEGGGVAHPTLTTLATLSSPQRRNLLDGVARIVKGCLPRPECDLDVSFKDFVSQYREAFPNGRKRDKDLRVLYRDGVRIHPETKRTVRRAALRREDWKF